MDIKGMDEIPVFSWNTTTKEFYVLGHKFAGVNSIEDFISYIHNLDKENQQLKEQLENNDCKTIYNQFVNYKNWYLEYVDKCEKLESVLDEIRDLIDKYNLGKYDYSIPVFDIQEILDKVKE